jgi:hypothetical protein
MTYFDHVRARVCPAAGLADTPRGGISGVLRRGARHPGPARHPGAAGIPPLSGRELGQLVRTGRQRRGRAHPDDCVPLRRFLQHGLGDLAGQPDGRRRRAGADQWPGHLPRLRARTARRAQSRRDVDHRRVAAGGDGPIRPGEPARAAGRIQTVHRPAVGKAAEAVILPDVATWYLGTDEPEAAANRPGRSAWSRSPRSPARSGRPRSELEAALGEPEVRVGPPLDPCPGHPTRGISGRRNHP